jgi:hypothetical protein
MLHQALSKTQLDDINWHRHRRWFERTNSLTCFQGNVSKGQAASTRCCIPLHVDIERIPIVVYSILNRISWRNFFRICWREINSTHKWIAFELKSPRLHEANEPSRVWDDHNSNEQLRIRIGYFMIIEECNQNENWAKPLAFDWRPARNFFYQWWFVSNGDETSFLGRVRSSEWPTKEAIMLNSSRPWFGLH